MFGSYSRVSISQTNPLAPLAPICEQTLKITLDNDIESRTISKSCVIIKHIRAFVILKQNVILNM